MSLERNSNKITPILGGPLNAPAGVGFCTRAGLECFSVKTQPARYQSQTKRRNAGLSPNGWGQKWVPKMGSLGTSQAGPVDD